MTGGDTVRGNAYLSGSAIIPLVIVGAVIGLGVAGWMATPEFVTEQNLRSILRAAALIGMIAVPTTLITIAGSYFSLSVSQTAAVSAISFVAFLNWEWPVWGAVLVVIVLTSAVGMLQGGAVALGGNPVIVTLAVGAALYGMVAWLTGNKTVPTATDEAEWIGTFHPLDIPVQAWAFALVTVVTAILLTRTRFGREVILVGANRWAATRAGLRPGRIAVYVFVVSSLGAALAGILTVAQFNRARLDYFEGVDINVIAAILVGGAAIRGGEGSATGTAVGALFIAALHNLMVLRGFSSGARLLAVGMVILVSASLFTLIRNERQPR